MWFLTQFHVQKVDKVATEKFKSTFTETEDTKSGDAVVESFSLKSTVSKPSNVSENSNEQQNKSNTVKIIQSDDQCKLVAAQNDESRLLKKNEKNMLEKTAQNVAKLGIGRTSRKISEDDLDGMRELLLQSMIRKTRETEKPPTRTVSIRHKLTFQKWVVRVA
jgi:hypothetical protein